MRREKNARIREGYDESLLISLDNVICDKLQVCVL